MAVGLWGQSFVGVNETSTDLSQSVVGIEVVGVAV
jgi:hypothetical protein